MEKECTVCQKENPICGFSYTNEYIADTKLNRKTYPCKQSDCCVNCSKKMVHMY